MGQSLVHHTNWKVLRDRVHLIPSWEPSRSWRVTKHTIHRCSHLGWVRSTSWRDQSWVRHKSSKEQLDKVHRCLILG